MQRFARYSHAKGCSHDTPFETWSPAHTRKPSRLTPWRMAFIFLTPPPPPCRPAAASDGAGVAARHCRIPALLSFGNKSNLRIVPAGTSSSQPPKPVKQTPCRSHCRQAQQDEQILAILAALFLSHAYPGGVGLPTFPLGSVTGVLARLHGTQEEDCDVVALASHALLNLVQGASCVVDHRDCVLSTWHNCSIGGCSHSTR